MTAAMSKRDRLVIEAFEKTIKEAREALDGAQVVYSGDRHARVTGWKKGEARTLKNFCCVLVARGQLDSERPN